MIFNSIEFLLFFPIVFVLYWFVTHKKLSWQNTMMLVASYIFYSWWDWRFLFLLVFSTVLDYYTGIKMYDSTSLKQRKFWFRLSVIINLGFLGFFKYYNFFVDSFFDSLSYLGITISKPLLQIILPVGISFYTFHGLSYVIDIYKQKIKPERDFVTYSLFVNFFPLLVAGPIERATHLLPQLKSKRYFSHKMFREGLLQISIGFFKKMVIADNLALYVDTVYQDAHLHNSSTLVIATVFYAFQIYFDFSGYSDIALGIAKLLGFDLLENFNLPYFSKSLTEFWRRWHMSLSFWLRDYLYISLGGNRKGILFTYRNLMITMLLGGLWHGASWNFVIWGGIHGLILSLEKFSFGKLKIENFGVLGWFITFVIVNIAWVFFRSPDFNTSIYIINKFFTLDYHFPSITDINIFANIIFALFVGIIFDVYLYRKNIKLAVLGSHLSIISFISLIVFFTMMIVLFYSSAVNFIYFQF